MGDFKISRRNFNLMAGAGVAALMAPNIAKAQSYPSQPVNIVVPFSPGGLIDRISRAMWRASGRIHHDGPGLGFAIESAA